MTGLTRFTSIRPARGQLSGPGLAWEREFLVLAVGNGRQAGGENVLCPEALLNDGLLDVRLMPRLPTEDVSQVFGLWLRGGLDAVHRSMVSARLPRLEMQAEEPLQVNLDGEPFTNMCFQVEVLPRRSPMKLPASCPLLT